MLSKTYFKNPVADPGFSREAPTRKGASTYYLAIFSWKLHENEESLARGEGCCASLAPPRSATANRTNHQSRRKHTSTNIALIVKYPFKSDSPSRERTLFENSGINIKQCNTANFIVLSLVGLSLFAFFRVQAEAFVIFGV